MAEEDYKAKYEALKAKHLALKLAVGAVMHARFRVLGHHGGVRESVITESLPFEELRKHLVGSLDWMDAAEYFGWDVEKKKMPR